MIDRTHENVLLVAKQLINKPYKKQGRNIKHGLDCIGVATWISQEFGADITDMINYPEEPSDVLMKEKMDSHLKQIDKSEAVPGDLILMRGLVPQHLALITEIEPEFHILHAYKAIGKITESEISDSWKNRIVGYYRFRFLDN